MKLMAMASADGRKMSKQTAANKVKVSVSIDDNFDDVYLNGRRSPEPNDTDVYDYYKDSLFPKSHNSHIWDKAV